MVSFISSSENGEDISSPSTIHLYGSYPLISMAGGSGAVVGELQKVKIAMFGIEHRHRIREYASALSVTVPE